MAENIKNAKLMPKGGGLVVVISGWPLAAIIAGGIGYCAYRHYLNEHKDGKPKNFSIFKKTEEQPKEESKELKENIKQKHNEIKAAVEKSFRNSKQTAEDIKVVRPHFKIMLSLVLMNIMISGVNSDVCSRIRSTSEVDNVFTKYVYRKAGVAGAEWYSKIAIIFENKYRYLWDTRLESIGKPIEENLLTKVQILDYQQSDCSHEECEELKKYVHLSLSFFHNQTKDRYYYAYNYVNVDEAHQRPPDLMPWNISQKGDPTISSQFNLWPKEWITQSNPCVAFDYWNKELIYIMNPDQSLNRNHMEVIRIPITIRRNGSSEYRAQKTNLSHKFVGLFNYRHGIDAKKIYAITKDMKLFKVTQTQAFEETDLNFQNMIGCKEQSFDWTPIIIIVVIVIVLIFACILMVIVYKEVYVPNNRTQSKKEAQPSTTKNTNSSFSVVTIDSNTGKPVRDQAPQDSHKT